MRSDAEGPFVLGGTLEERRKLAAEARKRAAARGKQLGPIRQRPVGRSINVRFELNLGIWPRYAARVALGTCSLLGWPESWLLGAQGAQLRDWLWDDEPKCLDGESILRAPLRAPPSWARMVCDADQHLLAFWPGSDGRAGLHIVLFGRHWLCLVIDPESEATPRDAWRMTIDAEPDRLTFDDLADEAYAKALALAQPESR